MIVRQFLWGKLILSKYVAESITTDCRMYRSTKHVPIPLPLPTAYKTVVLYVLYAVDKDL